MLSGGWKRAGDELVAIIGDTLFMAWLHIVLVGGIIIAAESRAVLFVVRKFEVGGK